MKKSLKIALITIITLLVLLTGAFYIYVSDFYKADQVAIENIMNEDTTNVLDDFIILSPTIPSDTALIFYPGAKVEYTAYAPILDKLRQNGITCVLVEMPFNLAILNKNAADEVFEELPNIENWFIGGHSMGGAMASSYAADHKDKVKGLILLGAYIYGDVSPENALTVYGTLNSNLEKNIDYTENVVIIEGGNHAQFGNYGEQKGDPPATISREEQQNIAVTEILDFIQGKSNE